MQNAQEEAVDAAECAVRRSRVNRFGKVLSDGVISLQTPEGTLELSMHECSSLFLQELNLIFPDKDLAGLIAMPTMQKSKLDLVGIGEGVELEKDRCLENFMSFAQAFQRTLHLRTYANTDANTDATTATTDSYATADGCATTDGAITGVSTTGVSTTRVSATGVSTTAGSGARVWWADTTVWCRTHCTGSACPAHDAHSNSSGTNVVTVVERPPKMGV